jgi:hypothetical protein
MSRTVSGVPKPKKTRKIGRARTFGLADMDQSEMKLAESLLAEARINYIPDEMPQKKVTLFADFLKEWLEIVRHSIREALKYAVKIDLIPANPADKVERSMRFILP